MLLEEIRGLVAMKSIREGVLKPSFFNNGWVIAVETIEGEQIPVTDDHDNPYIYHSLDRATEVLKQLDVSLITVVEDF